MSRLTPNSAIAIQISKLPHLDQPYALEAYIFMLEAVDYALKKLAKPRHLTAVELLRDIREYAYRQFGPMSALVLEKWQIQDTLDFGRIIFDLIEVELLRKHEKDSLEDFKDIREYDDIFQCRYEFDDIDYV